MVGEDRELEFFVREIRKLTNQKTIASIFALIF
jgi:hypothetical protein